MEKLFCARIGSVFMGEGRVHRTASYHPGAKDQDGVSLKKRKGYPQITQIFADGFFPFLAFMSRFYRTWKNGLQ